MIAALLVQAQLGTLAAVRMWAAHQPTAFIAELCGDLEGQGDGHEAPDPSRHDHDHCLLCNGALGPLMLLAPAGAPPSSPIEPLLAVASQPQVSGYRWVGGIPSPRGPPQLA